jgi:hypothetical protein
VRETAPLFSVSDAELRRIEEHFQGLDNPACGCLACREYHVAALAIGTEIIRRAGHGEGEGVDGGCAPIRGPITEWDITLLARLFNALSGGDADELKPRFQYDAGWALFRLLNEHQNGEEWAGLENLRGPARPKPVDPGSGAELREER